MPVLLIDAVSSDSALGVIAEKDKRDEHYCEVEGSAVDLCSSSG